jgi:hypothetical protein
MPLHVRLAGEDEDFEWLGLQQRRAEHGDGEE